MKRVAGYLLCILMLMFMNGCAKNSDDTFEADVSEEVTASTDEEQ